MEIYTSPSGLRYEVHPKTYTRKAGGLLEGCDLYDVEETVYDVFHSGAFATFALAENDVAAAVAHYENPGPDLGSYLD
jgi:hypothetical protein